MGPWVCKLLATLCVPLSLALFALAGANPTGAFCLQTLSFSRPTVIVRPILDTVWHILRCREHDMRGAGGT
jgi:hypothetical protein